MKAVPIVFPFDKNVIFPKIFKDVFQSLMLLINFCEICFSLFLDKLFIQSNYYSNLIIPDLNDLGIIMPKVQSPLLSYHGDACLIEFSWYFMPLHHLSMIRPNNNITDIHTIDSPRLLCWGLRIPPNYHSFCAIETYKSLMRIPVPSIL